ncbi:chemotaxis protein CheX [Sulfurimonas sp. MAG313]|nr:chemotaxis protein CheX [Sulfurimonas sp. MAG313]MDF1880146.1 chemotaxis protein CheX [Sulfurimonas sp. MAG313]
MRAVVRNRMGVFSPQGFLDGTTAPSMMNLEDIHAAEALKVDILLVSLKKVVFFNKNGLNVFISVLEKIHKKSGTVVGLCDYDEKKYAAVLKFYDPNLNFSLFRTQKIATLFISNTKEVKEKKSILVWHEDPSQRSALAIELFDRGHNPIVCQSDKEFEEKKDHEDLYEAVIYNSYLGLLGSKIATRVTGNAIIYSVSGFLDAEMAGSFDYTYHTNSLSVGFTLFIFDAYKVVSMNIHAVNYFSKLASSGAEYGANICIVGMTFEKTPIAFKEELEDGGLIFFENMDDILKDKELLKELGGSGGASSTNNRSLNKVLVNELPRFINATVNTMEMMTNAKAQKTDAKVNVLEIKEIEGKIASSIGFYGKIDGLVILVFPITIAKKACELLLGEKTDNMEDILDTLAEFVNIIAGRVKSLLAEQGISVDITLPRTYEDVTELLETVNTKKGVQVNLDFEGDNFTFFLTR